MRDIQLVELRGNAYERGCQYGAAAQAAIQQNVQGYLDLIAFRTGVGREAAFQAAKGFAATIETHAPDLWLELRGIADGAGCDLADILLINTRSELMSQSAECTALTAAAEVTAGHKVLLAQNWDWHTAVEPEPILLRIRQPDKPEILTLAEAGQLAKIGLNSSGLGLCLNFLDHADRGAGLPVHVLLRQMLGCKALGDAARLAYGQPRAGAANVLLAHAEGDLLDLELTARNADFLYADDGWLVHANHFESTRLRGGDLGVLTSMSSLARAARARRLLAAAAAERSVSMDTCRAILSDHAYGAYAICRHPEPSEPRLQQTATRASLIMDLRARTMYMALGQPCSEAYQEFRLEK
jgi:predicted choloylglycine hydrolase